MLKYMSKLQVPYMNKLQVHRRVIPLIKPHYSIIHCKTFSTTKITCPTIQEITRLQEQINENTNFLRKIQQENELINRRALIIEQKIELSLGEIQQENWIISERLNKIQENIQIPGNVLQKFVFYVGICSMIYIIFIWVFII